MGETPPISANATSDSQTLKTPNHSLPYEGAAIAASGCCRLADGSICAAGAILHGQGVDGRTDRYCAAASMEFRDHRLRASLSGGATNLPPLQWPTFSPPHTPQKSDLRTLGITRVSGFDAGATPAACADIMGFGPRI